MQCFQEQMIKEAIKKVKQAAQLSEEELEKLIPPRH